MRSHAAKWWPPAAAIVACIGLASGLIYLLHARRSAAGKAAVAATPAPTPELAVDTDRTRSGEATWYAVPEHSLARRRAPADEMTAASDDLPLQTLVRVTLLEKEEPRKTVNVRITDNGIHQKGVIIDLDHEAAEALGIVREGKARVRVEVLKETATSTPDPSATPR